ncbi:MAG: Hpt domain-containing protein [Bacteroidales bacterium]|nr:Hpt domain-containing protein [Bacteroidales bacterium]
MSVYKIINLEYLFEIAGRDKAIIKELADVFINQIDEFKTETTKAIDEKNYTYIKQLAHKFKSSLRTFGMETIAGELENIETNPELEKDFSLNETIDACIGQCELACDELQDFLQTN